MHTRTEIEDVRKSLSELLPELRNRYGVHSLAIFGSFARGEQTAESDLDVLVEFDKLPDLYDFVELNLDLEEALGLKVDLVTREDLKPRIARRVLGNLIPV